MPIQNVLFLLLIFAVTFILLSWAFKKAMQNKIKKYEEEIEELEKKLKKALAEAITDKLTNIANRRYIDKRLGEEIARVERYDKFFHVIFIDVNKLKEINDGHGHDKGDVLIKEVARLLEEHARDSDIYGRYGGDEFVWILPNTSKEGAILAAQRLYEDIGNITIPGIGEHEFSASFGIVGFNKDFKEDPIQAADRAMYHAKNNCLGISIIVPNCEEPKCAAE